MLACLCCLVLCLPLKYRVGCDCQIQPVVRRFVAAPYDGKLEKTLVEPGDEVSENQLLAQLDGRELRWELAGLEAELNRAEKSRDAAMAIDEMAEAQQAGLEVERTQLKMQLLQNRLENLEVRSPLAGIVISGDLKKTEGAPLSVGQVMFEVSPLDRMIVEVEIPEREILHVEAGAKSSSASMPIRDANGRARSKKSFPEPSCARTKASTWRKCIWIIARANFARA